MRLASHIFWTLNRINQALMQRDDARLEACFEGVDLLELLSEDTLEWVRVQQKSALVVLLSSLAAANDIHAARAEVWRDAYQSLAARSLQGALGKASAKDVLRLSVEALLSPTKVNTKYWRGAKGEDARWQEALEVLIDHRAWANAVAMLEYLGQTPTPTMRWLLLSKSLAKRHQVYVDDSDMAKPDVDYIAFARLLNLTAVAMLNAGASHPASTQRYLQARCLEVAREFKSAIEVYQKITSEEQAIGAQLAIARCQCKLGDLGQSIHTLDRVIPLHAAKVLRASSETTAATVLAEIQGEQAPIEKSFDTEAVRLALADAATVLNGLGQKFFLVSGTLLGFVRDGKLMDHDKDLDIGIIGWENLFDLMAALVSSGKFRAKAGFLKGADTFYLPIVHTLTEVGIDIFVYHPKGDQLVTGVDFFFGYRQTFAFTPFALKPIQFLGVDMFIPEDAELNLFENYGDSWRQPDTSYISHLESPSTEGKGELPHMLTARLQTVQALTDQRAPKLRKIVTVMHEHAQQPAAMSEALCERLLSCAQTIEAQAKPEVFHV